jgi:enoyl-[acyl-carrier protein] reductase I
MKMLLKADNTAKIGVIMGVLSRDSIAYMIAKHAAEQGAELYFTYPNEGVRDRVTKLAADFGFGENLVMCDVTQDAHLSEAFSAIYKQSKQPIDFVVHSIAFSDKNELKGRYVDTTRANFINTMDVSCYSLAAVCKHAEQFLADGASVLTLTYEGSRKVMPNYNVMGVAKAALEASVRYLANDFGVRNIRVNAISAGPILTLAASGINGFRSFLKIDKVSNPLKRNTTTEDVAGAAVFLLSDLAKGVTAEVLHVDCGAHAMGVHAPAAVE